MAADLHIHVFAEGELTEDDFRGFFSNSLGSKWFEFGGNRHYEDNWQDYFKKFSETASVWIGEVSWLKAALLEDKETFIPDPVSKISSIIGEDWPIVNDKLIARIRKALGLENQTLYSVSTAKEVIEFLELHKGKRAFTISW